MNDEIEKLIDEKLKCDPKFEWQFIILIFLVLAFNNEAFYKDKNKKDEFLKGDNYE